MVIFPVIYWRLRKKKQPNFLFNYGEQEQKKFKSFNNGPFHGIYQLDKLSYVDWKMKNKNNHHLSGVIYHGMKNIKI